MTSRDDIGRANLFRRRSHLEKFRDAVSFRFFLPFFFIYRRQIIVERVYIYYDHWLDYIIYTHVFSMGFLKSNFVLSVSFFFSTFIIDIYNARIRPVFKVELLNRQSDSF